MLTRDELLSFLHQGAKVKGMESIGIEYELFLMREEDFSPVSFRVLSQILESLRSQEVLSEEIIDGGHLLGLSFPDGAKISLEPGGQIEFTTPPLFSVEHIDRSVRRMYTKIEKVARKYACMPLSLGFIPHWREDDVFHVPKKRYDIMREYMSLEGQYCSNMMHRSCSFQINYDFHNEQDMIKKVRLILSLQPFIGALFTHSPLFHNVPYDNFSLRRHLISVLLDNKRLMEIVFQDSFGFDSYLTYLLEMPIRILSHEGEAFLVKVSTFRDYMNGRVEDFKGKYPSLQDFQYHTTTIFPDLRLRPFIEVRNFDSAPWSVMSSALALLTALVYDNNATEEVLSVLGVTDASILESLTEKSIIQGMDAIFQGQTLWQWTKRFCHIAHDALKRRDKGDQDETLYLHLAMDILDKKSNLAQDIQNHYRSNSAKVFRKPFLGLNGF